MGYLEMQDLADAKSFRTRVKMAIVAYAGLVLAEPKTGKTAAHYDKRTRFAVECLQDPEKAVGIFIYPVIANPTISQKGVMSEDGEIQYQIGQVWDVLAGVNELDRTEVEVETPSNPDQPLPVEPTALSAPA